jgi:hypothetical protein
MPFEIARQVKMFKDASIMEDAEKPFNKTEKVALFGPL